MATPDQEQLVRALCGQLEVRLRQGESEITEQLLSSHPELTDDAESVLDLIYAEITTREELGEAVDAAELRRRFPAWSDRIDRLISVHRALQAESLRGQNDTGASLLDTDPAAPLVGHHRPPQQIGPYQILGVIGRGGMGIVYRARESGLNRIVALKLIRESEVSGENGRRLIREAQTVARLDHPQIVRVHAAGMHDDVPYVCFEYIDGGSLADQLADVTLDPRAACRILRRLAEAMQYAHDNGVIHRDLKPANILLGRDGQPRIADFGLAKSVWECQAENHAERLTRTGAMLGSLCYMSPEQVAGQDRTVTSLTDIWGLGSILYEMLVGRPPFVRESPLETAHDIQFRDPVPPRTFSPSIPKDVETICLKCLEKDPHRRYRSAGELAEELQRWLDGEPILARPVGTVTRVVRWARRRPVYAALLTGLAALLMAIVLLQWRHSNAMSVVNSELNRSLSEESEARELADAHFWRAFDGVTSVQRQLADTGLEHEPRMQRTRLDAVDNALQIIIDLERERPDDARIATERGRLLKLRGEIQGDLGQHDESLQSFTDSRSVFTHLLQASPDDVDLRRNLAAAVCGCAEAHKWLMDVETAEQEYLLAVREFQQLAASETDNMTVQQDYGQAVISWASTFPEERREETAARLNEIEQLCRRIVTLWPESPRSFSLLGQLHRALGHVARDFGNTAEAEDRYARGIAALNRSLELAPGDRQSQVMLVETSVARVEELQKLRRHQEARAALEQSMRILTELRGRYPSIRHYRVRQISALSLASLLEIELGHESESVAFAEQAVQQRREMVAQFPDDSRAALELAADLANLANRLVVTKSLGPERLDRAVDYARESLTVHESFDFDPEPARRINQAANYSLALALMTQNQIEAARETLAALQSATSDTPRDLRLLADAWSEFTVALVRSDAEESLIADAHRRTLDELERAIAAGYRDHLELQETEVLDHFRNDPRFQSLLARAKDK